MRKALIDLEKSKEFQDYLKETGECSDNCSHDQCNVRLKEHLAAMLKWASSVIALLVLVVILMVGYLATHNILAFVGLGLVSILLCFLIIKTPKY